MGTYVTSTGFSRPTLQDLRLRFQERFKAVFGDSIDTDESGPTGQLIGILAKALADSWDTAQEVYASHDVNAALGTALDILAGLTGVYRIQAAATQVEVACYAAPANLDLVLSPGKQVKRTRGGLVFSLRDELTIRTAACRDIYLTLDDAPLAGSTVSLTTSFGTFSVTVPAVPDTTTGTYELLAAAINANAWGGEAQYWIAGGAPAGAQETDPCLRLVYPAADFGWTATTGWTALLVGSVGWFDCDTTGPNTALTGEVDQIVTPETGWEKVYNLTDGVVGRNVETDEELRLRRAQSFRVGYATEDAIRQALLNRVDGIVSAAVTSNRTLVTDVEGRPPKSFEVIVQGGLPADIGRVIWDTMPAGIESYANMLDGGVEVSVLDSQGREQLVYFARPVTRYLHLKIIYEVYSEEAFPTDGEAAIRSAVLAWAATEYTLGKDVIPQRALVPTYTVPGIGAVVVQVDVTDGEDDVPTWGTDVITVGGRTIVSLLDKNLEIAEAP